MPKAPPRTRPRLFLIDGYALIYRAFFALISRPLTTTQGENTSGPYGFARFLLKLLREYEPDYLGVVLDAGSSDRKTLFPEYKATREKMPDELRASLPRIRALMEAFRVPVLELDNQEADDVIGTLARQATERGLEAVIVSGDKDFYQLIGKGISLLNPGRGGQAMVDEEWVDTSNASERLGVPPERVVDYLALIGDASDNGPGAHGIGPKTAIKLLDEYGSVEDVLAHIADIRGKRAREALEVGEVDVRLSKRLVTIQDDLPIELDLDQLALQDPDSAALRDLFVELEFHSLARELGEAEKLQTELEAAYSVVDTADAIVGLVRRARSKGRIGLHVEGSQPDAMRGHIVGIGIAAGDGVAFYLPFAHRTPGVLDLEGVSVRNLPSLTDAALEPLVELLSDASIEKIGHDLKHDSLLLRCAGVDAKGLVFDTQVASYLIDASRRDHLIESLSLDHLGHRRKTRDEVVGKGREAVLFEEVDLSAARDWVAEHADIALRLHDIFRPDLERFGLLGLFNDMEMPLLPVLADMEWHGIAIDDEFFDTFRRKLTTDLKLVEEEIYKLAGEEFNINSTPQLRTVLFEKLGLPVLRKTKTGPSTDASVLEELAAAGHEIPRLIIEFRQLDKLKGTYIDALPQQVNQRTGRIHTVFSQTVAATGRLSSSDPNLQNIPIRTQTGAEIRKGFIPADGFLFLGADYSQIELRILAHMSGDPVMTDAFVKGIDVHRQTAALIFGTDIDKVTPDMRAAAKTVNFATIYGIGPFALSQQLGTSTAEAKAFIAQYFERLPGVRRYLDEQIEKAKTNGYVETLAGRRRYIPELRAKNWNIRQFGERVATNAPVQGTAADIIKIAMIRIDERLKTENSGARMLLQVHDELLFEVPHEEIDGERVSTRCPARNRHRRRRDLVRLQVGRQGTRKSDAAGENAPGGAPWRGRARGRGPYPKIRVPTNTISRDLAVRPARLTGSATQGLKRTIPATARRMGEDNGNRLNTKIAQTPCFSMVACVFLCRSSPIRPWMTSPEMAQPIAKSMVCATNAVPTARPTSTSPPCPAAW
jgi:DNA polymerase-1